VILDRDATDFSEVPVDPQIAAIRQAGKANRRRTTNKLQRGLRKQQRFRLEGSRLAPYAFAYRTPRFPYDPDHGRTISTS
jgi:hypothetical protein